MENEVAECIAALQSIDEAYRAGLRAFTKWFAVEWQLTRDEWVKSYAEAAPSDDYFLGWNRAIEAADAALDTFLDEIHP